ncbi:MAG: hypothetical protein KGJ13_04505 [Patescibacteria group bacterium]|nr:hypothetical protein [Patescibacteria group bacterium]
MKIFLCASKYNYGKVAPIKSRLEAMGHVITVPNSYDEPMKEEEMKKISPEAHQQWKAAMIRLQKEKVDANDAILVLNFEKNGQPNYPEPISKILLPALRAVLAEGEAG